MSQCARIGLGRTLGRGALRRCPRCGVGRLFRGWLRLHDSCDHCDLPIDERPGDTWGFWVIGDRVFILVPMILLYCGFTPLAWWARLTFLGIVLAALVLTMPHRLGVCIALDYALSLRLGDDR